VKLIVYDMLGREVRTLVNGELITGKYEYEFTGSNLASGVYFYRIEAETPDGRNNFVSAGKMILIK
jgi:hypothetical protein